MTGYAITGDTAVVEYCIRPTVDVVAVFTGITALNVIRWFTGCDCTVVTRYAGTLYFIVIDPDRW